MIKDFIQGFILIVCVIAIIIIGVVCLTIGIPYIEGRIKKEPISRNITYKCIQGSLWQLSEDRTYFYPAPSPTKCLTNEEVK